MAFRDTLQSALGTAYTLERELSGGGMSRVFVAEDTALQRKVVIKLLAPEQAAAVSTERFNREIRLAARLQHPHIVPLHAAGEADGLPYYTMPFISGESLREHVTRVGPLPIPEVVRILRDVTEALECAHTQGVVHRDIKPENILLTGDHALVADFGVAKAIAASTLADASTLTGTGIALGTPAYMAPEQAAGDGAADHRVDIYALGVVTYEMLAGRSPFAGRSPQQLIAAHITEVPEPVDRERQSVPPALSALVMQCLSKRPADRPQSAQEILSVLETLATPRDGTGVSGKPRVAVGRWVVAAAGLVMLAAALVAVFVNRPRPDTGLNRNRVVVAPFMNLTGDSTLNVFGPLIAEGVTRGLLQLDSIEVMSSQTGLTDANGRLRTIADLGTLPSLGEETRAGRVIGGSYSRQGDTLRLEARIVNARDGRVETTLDPVTGSVSAPHAAIERLRESVVTALQASQAKAIIGSIGHLPTLGAYREFIDAVQADVESDAGRVHLINATRLDTTFTLAQVLLTANYAGWSRWKAADSMLHVLSARAGAFSPVERELFAEIDAYARHDWERDVVAFRQLLKRDSTVGNVGGLTLSALAANRAREALATIQTTPVARIPKENWGYPNKTALADHMLGDYRAELATATSGRLHMTRPFAQLLMFEKQTRALAALGDLAALRQKVDSAIAAWNSSERVFLAGAGGSLGVSTYPAAAYERLALELQAHGQPSEAVAYVRKGLAWHASNPTTTDTSATDSLRISLARLLMLNGNLDSARAIWMTFASRDTLYTGARISLATVAARQRDTVAALRTMHILDSLGRLSYAFGQPRVGEARIAAALGHKDEAVRLLKRAMSEGAVFGTSWHSDADFQSLQDYPAFQALMRPVDFSQTRF